MGKTATLNIRVNPDVKENVEDAASAFVAFRERH